MFLYTETSSVQVGYIDKTSHNQNCYSLCFNYSGNPRLFTFKNISINI